MFLSYGASPQQNRNFPGTTSLDSEEVEVLTKLMEEKIIEENIEFVGFNCMYSGLLPPNIHLAERVKKINSSIKVSIGGIHPTLFAKEILNKYENHMHENMNII